MIKVRVFADGKMSIFIYQSVGMSNGSFVCSFRRIAEASFRFAEGIEWSFFFLFQCFQAYACRRLGQRRSSNGELMVEKRIAPNPCCNLNIGLVASNSYNTSETRQLLDY